MRVVGLDAQVMKLDLCLRPGKGRGSLEGGWFPVLVGQVQCRFARFGKHGREDHVSGASGREVDPATEAEDRVQDRPHGVREGTPIDHRRRPPYRMTTAQEPGPVGLELDGSGRVVLDRRDMCCPELPFVPGPWTAGRHQRADVGYELGLHEQVLEGRMSGVGVLRSQGDLGV